VKGQPLIFSIFHLLISLLLSLSTTTPVLSLYSVCCHQDSNWPWLHKSGVSATFIHESSESNNSSRFITMRIHILSFETEFSSCMQSYFPHFENICVGQTNWNDSYSCSTILNGWWHYKRSYSNVYLWMCSHLISPTVIAWNITGKVCVCFLIHSILQRREVLHLR